MSITDTVCYNHFTMKITGYHSDEPIGEVPPVLVLDSERAIVPYPWPLDSATVGTGNVQRIPAIQGIINYWNQLLTEAAPVATIHHLAYRNPDTGIDRFTAGEHAITYRFYPREAAEYTIALVTGDALVKPYYETVAVRQSKTTMFVYRGNNTKPQYDVDKENFVLTRYQRPVRTPEHPLNIADRSEVFSSVRDPESYDGLRLLAQLSTSFFLLSDHPARAKFAPSVQVYDREIIPQDARWQSVELQNTSIYLLTRR
jgi:hypothetical protein